MRCKDLLKRVLPVPASSFYRRMDAIDAQLEKMRVQQQIDHTLLESMRWDVPQKKAFYLICEPGFPNYGDELIAAEWLKYLAAAHPDVPVIMDCLRPGPASAILRGYHPHLTVVDTVARLTFENEYAEASVGGYLKSQTSCMLH